MVRVRFAPSPTGALHLGSALTAVANRRFADERSGLLTLRIDDTDVTRVDPEAEAGILRDLEWLGVIWDEGPLRQSDRLGLYRDAATRLLEEGHAYDDRGTVRFQGERNATLLRSDGSATYHLASVVDDAQLAITHVIRGRDHLPNTELHRALARALGAEPPEYVHHGLLVGADGQKLSKRHGAASVADLRGEGIPAEAVRAYLEELDLPRHDVQLDLARVRRLSVDAITALPDEELCARVDAPPRFAAALRGARTLAEARDIAAQLAQRPAAVELDERGRLTAERFTELREQIPGDLDADAARTLLRELKAVGGDLRSLRLVLTGVTSGPELWAVLVVLTREETLARVSAGSHN